MYYVSISRRKSYPSLELLPKSLINIVLCVISPWIQSLMHDKSESAAAINFSSLQCSLLDQQSRIQKLSSGLATQQFLTAHFYLVVYFHPDLTFQAVRSLRWKWIQFFWVQTLYWYSIFKHYFTIFWFLNTHLFIFFGRVWICFFYFISKRIASEFSCKKCISFT